MRNSADMGTDAATFTSMDKVHKLSTIRLQEALTGVLPVIIQGDYGPKNAALCDDHLKQLSKAKAFVPIIPL